MLRQPSPPKPPYFSLASLQESLNMVFPPTIAAMVWQAVAIVVPKLKVEKTGNYIGANLLLGTSSLIAEFLVRTSKYVCIDKMSYDQATKKAWAEAFPSFPSYVLWQPLYDTVTGMQNFDAKELIETLNNNKFNVKMVPPRWSVKPWLHLAWYQGLAIMSHLMGASWRDTTCIGALSTGFQISTDHAVADQNLALTNASGDPAGWSTVWNIGASGLYTAAAGFFWDILIWKTCENLYELYKARQEYYAALAEAQPAPEPAPIDLTISPTDEKTPSPPAAAPDTPKPTSPLRAAGMHKSPPTQSVDSKPADPLLPDKKRSAWAILRLCGY